VDYNQIFKAITFRYTGDQSDAGSGQDDEDAEGVIWPLLWRNAPKSDGSTVEFNERLERCREFMHRFAMHTPFYYLAFEKHASDKGGKGKATRVQRSEGGVKAVNMNAGRKQRKRKVQDVEDEDQGLFQAYITVQTGTNFNSIARWREPGCSNWERRSSAPKEKDTVW
jgi:hypothetical protein